MPFNNIPINGWPQIKDLEKLDALAKQIENMPSYTSTDRAFLDEWEVKLPDMKDDVSNLETTKANQITIAPTFSAEDEYSVGDLVYYNGLSYRCVNAHTGEWDANDFIPTTIAIELANKTVIDYSATEQNTRQKWVDGKDIYTKSIDFGALPNNTSKTFDISALGIDIIIDKKGCAFNNDKSAQFILPHLSLVSTSSITLDANRSIVAVTTGSDRSNITNCYVTLFYTKLTT